MFILFSGMSRTQDCGINATISIPAFDSTFLSLDIDGLINDDLSTGDLICGIRLFFDHDQIGNLRFILISPEGQSITLIGPGTMSSGLTPAVSWNILQVPCSGPAAPDAGFSDQWDNQQSWASFNTYNGVYYPHSGCFEDFNVGSANGTWTLMIENLGPLEGLIEYFEIIFCDPQGINCEPCYLSAGDLASEFYTTCQQDRALDDLEFLLEANPIIESGQSFQYVLSLDDEILAIENTITQSDTLAPGEYRICGIAYDNADSLTVFTQQTLSDLNQLIYDRMICAETTDPCLTLLISPVENIVEIDTSFCDGDTLRFLGLEVFNDLDTNILRENQISCDSLIIINAEKIIVDAELMADSPSINCGQSIFINASGSSTNGTSVDFIWTTLDGNFELDVGPIAEVNRGGTYTVEFESENCSDTTSITIPETSDFQVDLVLENNPCFGDPFIVTITNSASIDSILVTGTNIESYSKEEFEKSDEGWAYVYTEYMTCTRLDSIFLEYEATEIEIEVSSSVIDCDNTMSLVNVITNASNAVFYYDGEEVIIDTTSNIMVATPGIYSVTVNDENGCEGTSAFIVEGSAELPQLMTEDISVPCNAPNPALPLDVISIIDSLVWQGPNNFISREPNPIAVDTGVYTVTIYTPNGCEASREVLFEITNVTPLYSIIGDTLDCATITANICIPNMEFEIQWNLDGAPVSNENCLMTNMAGVYDFLVTDQDGCFTIGTYELLDLADSGADDYIDFIEDSLFTYCNIQTPFLLDPVFLDQSASFDFEWTRNGIFHQAETNLSAFEEGEYILETVNTLNQCIQYDTVVIQNTISELLESPIEINVDSINCNNENADLSIDGIDFEGIELLINGMPTDPNFPLELSEGDYEIILIDINGCERAWPLTISSDFSNQLDLGQDIIGQQGDVITLDINSSIPLTEIDQFIWSDTSQLDCTFCLNPTLILTENQTLILELIDINGCSQTDSLNINLEFKTDIYIPNIFSPDSDGDNAIWQIYQPDGNVKVFDFRIFDRWGNLVIFHSEVPSSPNLIWDGRYNNEDAEQGVYIYTARIIDKTNQEKRISGQITLLR